MSTPLTVIKLEAALLRSALPDLVLRPGAVLAARVGERRGDHGLLMLAGSALVAELPKDVKPGDRLRLEVQPAEADRVVLRILDGQALAAAPVPLPLLGGASSRVRVEERDSAGPGGAEEHRSVVLVYDSPALGALELRVSLDGGNAVAAQVTAGAGTAFALAEDGRAALEEALGGATGRRAHVSVLPRRDPLDVYA